jgi:hypothetical protein
MELEQLFKRVAELASKFPKLTKEETTELMKLSKTLSAVCSNALYDWDRM